MAITLEKIVNLCKRRGIIFPGSEIYGGLANSYDFGHLGNELVENIKKLWWRMFVQEREDIIGLRGPVILSSKVWDASGHLKNFSDPLIECNKCNSRFRWGFGGVVLKTESVASKSAEINRQAQELHDSFSNSLPLDLTKYDEEALRNVRWICPVCKTKNPLSKPRDFNLMFKTNLGPIEAPEHTVYLRPETAQAMFVDFLTTLSPT